MKHVRKSGRLLAALLALLMVISTVIALPVVAEESSEASAETSAIPSGADKAVLYSFTFLKGVDGAGKADMTTAATDSYLLTNGGFSAGYLSSSVFTTDGLANYIDKNGFYRIMSQNTYIAGYDRTTTTGEGDEAVTTTTEVPKDFFNLFYGLYNNFDRKGITYTWEFDLHYLKNKDPYVKKDSKGFTYVDEENNEYTEIYTLDVGHSFFASTAGTGMYDSLFRISGDGYLYSGSTSKNVTVDNAAQYGNLYVMSGNQLIPIAENGELKGTLTNTGTSGDDNIFKISGIVDRENAYQLTVNKTYHMRVEFAVTSASTTNKDRTITATVYITPKDGSAEEHCVGSQSYTYSDANASNASRNLIRVTDSGHTVLGIGGTWKIYADALFYEDLSDYGNATGSTQNAKALDTQAKLKNIIGLQSFSGSTVNDYAPANLSGDQFTLLSNGYLKVRGQSTVIANYDKSNPVYELLTGTFPNAQGTEANPYYNEYFFEFGYKPMAFPAAVSTADYNPQVTITKGETTEKVTITSGYYDTGNGYMFRDHSNGTAEKINNNKWALRMTNDGHLYVNQDNPRGDLTTVASGVDGYYYYTGTVTDGSESVSTTIYFDGEGYRYWLKDGVKIYIDEKTDAAPTVSSFTLKGMLKPAAYPNSYQLTKNAEYRIGIKYSTTVSSDTVTVTNTVYIKQAGAENWEKCLGSCQWVHYRNSPQVSQRFLLSGSGGAMTMGKEMVAYTYTCNYKTGKHPDALYVGEKTVNGRTYKEYKCTYCEGVWGDFDGKIYAKRTVSNTCNGSYTLWGAVDGSCDFFMSDRTAGSGNHTLNSAGVCSKCGYSPAWENFPMSYEAARQNGYTVACGKASGVSNQDYNGSGSATAPTYDSQNGYISAPDSGMILRNFPDWLCDYASPFVISMDFCLDGGYASKSTATSAKAWDLLTLRNGIGSASAYMYLVGVQMGKDANGNETNPYLTLGIDSNKKACDLEYEKWYNVQVVGTPLGDSCRVYLDGEYVGTNGGLSFESGATAAAICVGIQTQQGPYCFGYKAKNISYEQKTINQAYDLDVSNRLFSLRYDRYENESGMRRIGSLFGTFTNELSISDTPAGQLNTIIGGQYGLLKITGDQYRDISLSTMYRGEEFGLSGKKYEILMRFAVSSTEEFRTGEGDQLVRLSKYSDAIQTFLVKYGSNGQYYGGAYKLYNKNGEPLYILRDFDETTGIPTDVTELRVVVDEKNNKFSVYIDGNVAYFWTGNEPQSGEFLPFFEQEMPAAQLGKDDATKDFTRITEVDTYGAVTKAIAEKHGYTGSYQYMRLFRNITTVAVEEISLTLIPDSDIEFIGAQVRTADATEGEEQAFDLRFIFGLDDLYIGGLGFDVTATWNDGGVQRSSTQDTELVSAVYRAVAEGTECFYAYRCSEGHYLAAFKILGITETSSAETYTFHIVPYTIGADGMKMPSTTTYVVTCDGLGGNIQTQTIEAE